ncbi:MULTISPECIES: AI-2E family transporter [unclassified Modestobacter]|uniref:AI-2E family transporter n=1 Tax=unclassified Modestobacter TaxID=2643866 RepID=UPI0022AAD155|nr:MULTISPECIES: AI-2E family transporter [unclassified Modestobacter]MCZ2823416.1 AI-2E family transporter [Modestobacter sp. VKM Ac-2981]MCZ2851661.1 AI-2E family transporter [Modestobacter sp. VKM Ac-2982]
MFQRARRVVDRARERIRAAAEHDPHAWPDGTVLVLQDGSRAVVDHVEEPHQGDGHPGDGHHATSAPRHDAAPLAPGSPHPDAPDVDVPGGVSGPPAPGGAPPAPGRDRARGSLLAPEGRLRAAERDVPNGLRIAAAWSWRTVAVVAALYLLLRAAGYVAVVIVPVIVALLLAALLQPGVASLRRSGWPTSLAALTMLVVGVGVVAGIVTLVVEEFAAGYADLVSQVDEGLTQVQDFITRTFPVTDGQITDALESASQSIADNQDALTSGALTTAATVGEVLTGALLTLFTLFFFLLDGRQIWLWVVGLTPVNSQAYLDEAARRSWRTLISYVRATVGVAAFDAVFIGIGLVFLGTPLVVPLAALVFLGAFIPIIGSFLAGTVSVLVTLVAVGPVRALIALGIIVLIMQLESHVLQPLLLGRAVSVHPLAVVLGIAAGLLIGGVFGALIAVPVIACGNVAGTYLSRRHEGPRPPQPDTRRARRPVTAR